MVCWAGLSPLPALAEDAAGPPLLMTAADSTEKLTKAAAGGNAIAKLHLADKYRSGDGVPKDLMRASVLLHEAAELGVARAQSTLGWMYLEGDGAPRDVAVAIKWFEAAAAQGDSYSLFHLARVYGAGIGVPKDEDRAWTFAGRAAELQNADAMAGTAVRMLSGPPEQRNLPRAIGYLTAATDADQQFAIYLLGKQYCRGVTGRDSKRAFQALQRASDRNSLAAKVWIAQAYARGFGVTADVARAEELFRSVQAQAKAGMVNDFSWELAVSPEESFRDAGRAITLMESLLADPKNVMPTFLDTLAAAYAAGGQFADAIATQLRAIEKAAADSRFSGAIGGMKSRLELYRIGRAYTEQR